MSIPQNFEQVPVELAKKIAAREKAQQLSADKAHSWQELARAIVEEKDSGKMMDLVVELTKALDGKPPGKVTSIGTTIRSSVE